MSAEHERVAGRVVDEWISRSGGALTNFDMLRYRIRLALAAASSRADEAGWRRGHAEALMDYQPKWSDIVARAYTPPAERPTI